MIRCAARWLQSPDSTSGRGVALRLTCPVTTACEHAVTMRMFPDEVFNDYAECAVCRTDTPRLCSPCGDPVCENCRCPNGCETALIAVDNVPHYAGRSVRFVEAA